MFGGRRPLKFFWAYYKVSQISKSEKYWVVIRYYKFFFGFLACYKVSQPKFVVPFNHPSLYEIGIGMKKRLKFRSANR